MSADEAIERGWARLRRAVLHREHNPEAKAWRDISDRNNFSAGVAAAMKRRDR